MRQCLARLCSLKLLIISAIMRVHTHMGWQGETSTERGERADMLSHAARRSCGHLRSQSVRRTARGVAERAGTRVAPAPSSAGTAEAAGKAAGMVAVQVLPGSAKAVTNDQAPGEWYAQLSAA